jgi:hypothetical protein
MGVRSRGNVERAEVLRLRFSSGLARQLAAGTSYASGGNARPTVGEAWSSDCGRFEARSAQGGDALGSSSAPRVPAASSRSRMSGLRLQRGREFSSRRCSCGLTTPSPPGEKAAARQDQTRQSRTGDGTGEEFASDATMAATNNAGPDCRANGTNPHDLALRDMMPDLAIALAIGLVIGFVLGYGVRAFMSYRRHKHARRRSHFF